MVKAKSKLAELEKKVSRLSRTVSSQRRTIREMEKSTERRSFAGNSSSVEWREEKYKPTSGEDYLQLFEIYEHVFSCVDAIARNAASIPFKIFHLKKLSATKDKYGEEITDGPWWSLLNTPNPFSSGSGLIYSLIAFQQLVGSAYLEKVGPNAQTPMELWALRPDWMTIKPDPKTLIREYQYEVDGVITSFKPEEIFRFKSWHPRSELYGLSPISPAANSVITDLYCMKYTKQFFKNGGHINWYLSLKDEEISDAERARIEQTLKTKFSGMENAHTPAVFSNGGELKELGQSPDRNTLLPQKTLSRKEVYEVYGVPAVMGGFLDEATYNNVVEQERIFWQQKEQPLIKELVDGLNRDIFWPNDMEVVPDYSGITVLQPAYGEKATAGKTLVDGRIFLPNEVRSKLFGLDPIEGGDVFPQAPSQQPFGFQMNKSNELTIDLVLKLVELVVKGGPGSGNFNHAGIPGQVGGSAPSGGLSKVPAQTVSHFTPEQNVSSIKENGFNYSNNSMYGQGVYFVEGGAKNPYSGNQKEVQAVLAPHNQLAIKNDIDVPREFNRVTGKDFNRLSSEQVRQAWVSAGVQSLRFPVDNQEYVVVTDKSIISVKKGGIGSGHHGHYPSVHGAGSAKALTKEVLDGIEKDIASGRFIDAYDRLREHGLDSDLAKKIISDGQRSSPLAPILERHQVRTKKATEEIKKAALSHRDKMLQYVHAEMEPWAIDGFKEMGQAVLAVIGKMAKAIAFVKKDMVTEAVASLDAPTKKMAAALLKMEKGLLKKIIADEMKRAKKTEPDEKLLSEIIEKQGEQLERMVNESMESVSDTVKDRTEKKLAGMLESNAGVDTMRNEFQEMFEGTEREGAMWARTVARTESLRFAESSRFQTLSAMGFAKKEWIHSGDNDEMAREDHIAADGEIVPMDKKFSMGLLFPGDPVNGEAGDVVNCRCTFIEHVGAAAEEDEE